MSNSSVFRVAVVGRMNVGKSTLFNRLSEKVKSITYDLEGVTRDTVTDMVTWQGVTFQLLDTAGISLRKTQDAILAEARERALRDIKDADLAVLICDVQSGVVPEDMDLARQLHRMHKRVLLVVNKVDRALEIYEKMHEFRQLGCGEPIQISAAHGTGIADLLEGIVNVTREIQPTAKTFEESEYGVVFVGKPNVGKSSLMNALLNRERAIVTDVPGTTREALDERIQFYKAIIKVTDTPGVRRKRGVTDPLEELMVKSTMSALKRADIVLLLVDASQGVITDQELKLLFYAFTEQHKAVIVLYNKQDIVQEFDAMNLKTSVSEYEYILKKVAQLNISCKTGHNIGKILPLVEKVWERHSQTLGDEEVTIMCKEALARKPLFYQQQQLFLYSIQQVKSAPITLIFKVSQAHLFGKTQLAFFERIIRQHYDLVGVPLVLIPRTRG